MNSVTTVKTGRGGTDREAGLAPSAEFKIIIIFFVGITHDQYCNAVSIYVLAYMCWFSSIIGMERTYIVQLIGSGPFSF